MVGLHVDDFLITGIAGHPLHTQAFAEAIPLWFPLTTWTGLYPTTPSAISDLRGLGLEFLKQAADL